MLTPLLLVTLASSSAFVLPAAPPLDDARSMVRRSLPPDKEEGWRNAWEKGVEFGQELATRFTSPRIDDEGLVITDGLVTGIVAPGLEAIVCVVLHAPLPTWTTALGPKRLIAPVLLRGSTLASCWLGGALAARLYERSSYDFPGAPDRFKITLSRVLQGGCFATALLIFSTQVQVAVDLGPFATFGIDAETDLKLLRYADDLIRDVVTESVLVVSWRLARTYLSKLD